MKDLVITDVSQFVLLFPSLLDETLRLYEDDKLFLVRALCLTLGSFAPLALSLGP